MRGVGPLCYGKTANFLILLQSQESSGHGSVVGIRARDGIRVMVLIRFKTESRLEFWPRLGPVERLF